MERVDKCCYVQRVIDQNETAIFWFDITQSGVTLFPMIKTPGKCIKADLVGIPTSLPNQQFLEMLDKLKERAIERLGKRLVLLPPITEPYDGWMRRLPSASGQEKAQLQIRITHVESWVNAYYSGLINHDQEEVMVACNRLGIAYQNLGELQAAVTCGQKMLSLAILLDRRNGVRAAHSNLGTVYGSLGQYEKAIEFINKCLVDARKVGDHKGEGGAYNNLGKVYTSLGQYEKAIEFLSKCLVISKKTGDRKGEGGAYGNLGTVYTSLDQYEKAIEYHNRCLIVDKEIGDRKGESGTYGSLGTVYHSLGQYEKAVEVLNKSLVIAKEIGDREGESGTYGSLGTVYHFLGQYEKALEYYNKHLVIAKEIGDREGEGNAYGNLGAVYRSLGQYEKAVEVLNKSLVVAKEIGNRRGEGIDYGILGTVYDSLGQYEKAIECHNKHLAIAKEIGDWKSEGGAHNNLGISYEKNNQPIEAEKAFRQSIEIFSHLQDSFSSQNHAWKISLFEEVFRPYRHLEALLFKQDRIDEALQIVDSGRARALAALVKQRRDVKEVRQEPLSVEQIQRLSAELKSTFIIYSSNAFDRKEVTVWIVSSESVISKALQVDQLLSSVTKGRAALNTLTTEGAVSKGLAEATEQLANQLESQVNPEEMHQQLRQWHHLLIEPLLPHLPKSDGARVAIFADSSLHHLPFAVLRDPEGKYLLEKYTLYTAPSAEVLHLLMTSPKEFEEKLLVIADPTDNLPYAYQEGRKIGETSKATSLIRGEATLAKTKAALPSASMIHFTGHGTDAQTNPQSVFGGGLQLADGLLSAEEVVKLDIKADLVVLNGCRTGGGELKREGLIGPEHAFLGAGASTVIGSHWIVEDKSSKQLMLDFHKRVREGVPKAEALRGAMLEAMKQNPDKPWLWGAFRLQGLP